MVQITSFWLCVDGDENELIFVEKPVWDGTWLQNIMLADNIYASEIPNGTIKKILGYTIPPAFPPVEVSIEKVLKTPEEREKFNDYCSKEYPWFNEFKEFSHFCSFCNLED